MSDSIMGGSILHDLEHWRETGLEKNKEFGLGLLGLRHLGRIQWAVCSPHRGTREAENALCMGLATK